MALMGTLPASAQTAAVMQNPSARQQQTLNGRWTHLVDPYSHGGSGKNARYGKDLKFTGEKLQDYDFETALPLKVPGDWNSQREKLYYYEGVLWYHRHFNFHKTNDMRTFLRFEAVNYEATVFLNGKWVTTHTGGFAPFENEVDSLLQEGDNSIVVRVDNTRKRDAIPSMNCDWWNYGGITRPVNLISVPKTFIRDYQIALANNKYVDEKTRLITGFAQLNGTKPQQKVTIEIPELKVKQTVVADANGKAMFSVKAKPQLWTPAAPKLYTVNISSETDKVTDEIGFRTIETLGDKILLNGKETFLAGVNIHEEAPNNEGRAWTRKQDSTLLQYAKDLGCNFVRLAHYPHNEEMVRLADKMGLMVWSEIPLYWGINWKSQETYNLAETQLRDMINRDKNRCSIVMWSVANETQIGKDRNEFLTKLAHRSKELDSSRLVCAALLTNGKGHNKLALEDPLADAIDILSFNEYVGWYVGNGNAACDSTTWIIPTGKPVVVSEFGGGARKGRHGDKEHFFTEDKLVELYKAQFRMISKMQGLAGTIPWCLMDFHSPHRVIPGVQDDLNRKGLLSEKGERKQAWQIVKDWNISHIK